MPKCGCVGIAASQFRATGADAASTALDDKGLPAIDIASEGWCGDLSGGQNPAGEIKPERHGLVFEWKAGSYEQGEHRHSARWVSQNYGCS